MNPGTSNERENVQHASSASSKKHSATPEEEPPNMNYQPILQSFSDIEEQRHRNQEALQQAKTDKNKKEKKFKKWGKKTKEKNEERNPGYEVESKSSEELDSKIELSETNCTTSHTLPTRVVHVKNPRQRKQDKGDECLQQLSSSEETDEPSSFNNPLCNDQTFCEDEKILSVETSPRPNDNFKLQTAEELPEHLEDSKEKNEENDSAKPCKKSPVKKSKRNKPDNLESTAENVDSRENKIINVIKSANLAEDEVQHIVDALNGRQKSEKKKNDTAILKKLIQDKEDSLKSEQRTCQAANEKINDLQQEINDIKAQASGTEKSLRETLKQEQQEIKDLHAIIQRKLDQYSSEMNSLQSKMQQMKNKLKEEHALALQRFQEENSQLQSLSRIESEKQQRSTVEISRLQHEIEQLRCSREKYENHQTAMQQNQEELHHQIKQLEKHIEEIVNSHQEEEYRYKQRINEMSNKIQQTENSRSSLVQELQNAQSVCSSLEADNSSLRQRVEEAKHKLNNSEQEIIKLKNRLESTFTNAGPDVASNPANDVSTSSVSRDASNNDTSLERRATARLDDINVKKGVEDLLNAADMGDLRSILYTLNFSTPTAVNKQDCVENIILITDNARDLLLMKKIRMRLLRSYLLENKIKVRQSDTKEHLIDKCLALWTQV